MDPEAQKREAATRAVQFVQPGMRLGLGTGSTVKHFLDLLAGRMRDGCKIVGVPTSEATRAQAERLGIPLIDLDQCGSLNLTVDGADEIDPELRLIKGGGGALLGEKIVAMASERMVVIADHSKRVAALGAFPLPVEIVPFGAGTTHRIVSAIAAEVGCQGEIVLRQRPDGQPFRTEGGHLILDCAFGRIDEPEALDEALKQVPGVVESGLFLNIADAAFIAGPDGVELWERDADPD
jgi:ribose 5-phosphate isomerase A